MQPFIGVFCLITISFVTGTEVFSKCCDYGFVLNDSLQCVVSDNNTQSIFQAVNETETINLCHTNHTQTILTELRANTTHQRCKDLHHNGTVITLSCGPNYINLNNDKCDSVMTVLDFWGATIVVFATILYTIPYSIVIIIYCILPELRVRAYDRSVVSFNCSYMIVNILLIFIGFHELCHKTLPGIIYALSGLIMVYLTQCCCIWLLIICIDMTSVITKFRWSPASQSRLRDDKKKFRIYSAWTWGLSLIPPVITAFMEFNSFLPADSILRPKLADFHGNHSKSLLIYMLIFPVLTLFSNSVLFCYTTYRVIKMQRDNAILNKNSVKNAKKKYFLYLKLYFIMDAPWLSGALSAAFPGLWYLKFVRIIQPVLMLIVIVPRKRILEAFGCMKNTSQRICAYGVCKTID